MKYDELVSNAISIIEHDDDIFVNICEELDSWNGFLGNDRLYEMDLLDEFFGSISLHEFLNKLGNDFSNNDEYFYVDGYGWLASTSESKRTHYEDLFSAEELFDNFKDNYSHIDVNYISAELDELMEQIDNYQE